MSESEDKQEQARAAVVGVLLEKRALAIRQKNQTGIEAIWAEDEDAYENQYTGADSWRNKPPGKVDISTTANGARSAAGYNITSTYCDTGAASMGDMLFSTDEQPWSISHTAIPDLVQIAEGNVPPEVQGQIDTEASQADQDPEEVTRKLIDETKKDLDRAQSKAEKVEKRIADWLQECQYISSCRDVLFDSALSGSGVLKGPVPRSQTTVAYVDGRLVEEKKTVPVSSHVSYWNAFPDHDAGENIHDGNFFFEKDDLTLRQMEGLLSREGYFTNEVISCIREGPHRATANYKNNRSMDEMGLVPKTNTWEIWYGYLSMNHEDLVNAGFDVAENSRSPVVDLYVELINGRAIKVTENPLYGGAFPYDIMVWKRRKGSPWGTGIARQVRTPQRMVDASIRNLMKNAGVAAGPMLGVMRGVRPVDNVVSIAPWKIWEIDPTDGIDDVRKAIGYVKLDMMINELGAIIDRGLKMAEDITGLPQLLQGQSGGAPDTVGGMTLLHNNATALRRRIARQFDDKLTSPHIRRYFNFHLLYGPDEEKGDFHVTVKGSSTHVERDLHSQAMVNLAQMFLNPAFGKDPKRAADEYLKALKFNPSMFDYEDAEWQRIVEQMGQPPSDSRLEVEQIRAQNAQQMLQAKQQFEGALMQARMEMEQTFKALDLENEQRKQAGQEQLKLAEIQARFAETDRKIQASMDEAVLKLQVQQQLSGVKSPAGTQQVLTPPSEPAGRAPNGSAYQA